MEIEEMVAVESLKVSKYTVQVDVRNVLGEEIRLEVFLAEQLRKDGRAESLHDVLETRRFIPAKGASGTELVSVTHLSWVRMALIEAIDELDFAAEAEGASVLAPVRVELDDGSWLEGAFRYAMPIGRRRLVDYLSALPRWVPLRKDDWLYLIGRERIVRVIPREVA